MIWNLKTPNKVKYFLWRACTNSLPTKEQLWKRKCTHNQVCPCCFSCSETVEHLLLLCSDAKAVWFCGPLSLRLDEYAVNRFDCWCHEMLSNSNLSHFSKALVSMTCWAIWKSRCSLSFEGKPFLPVDIMCTASRDLSALWDANKWPFDTVADSISLAPSESLWKPPL